MPELSIIFKGDAGSVDRAAAEVVRSLGQIESAAKKAGSSGQHLSGMSAHVDGLAGSFRRATETAAGFVAGQVLIGGISRAWDGLSDSIVGFNSKLENAQTGFATLLGSGEKAKALLSDLQQFAKATPFDFPGLVTASQRMLAFGFAGEEVLPVLKSIGDRMAATGDISTAKINQIITALGQIAAKGRVQGDELLQLTEAGVNGLRLLAEGFGVSTGKMQQMVEQGIVPADKAIKYLVEGMERDAPDAMAKMAGSWSAASSNVKDSLQQLVAGGFKPLFDGLTEGTNRLAGFLQTDRVERFASETSGLFRSLSEGFAAQIDGDTAKASAAFDEAGLHARAVSQDIQTAFLTIGNAAAPAVEPIVGAFATLASNAAQWGANIIGQLAGGMAAAAGSVLSGILNDIVEYIGSWFPQSPAKRGVLAKLPDMGQEIIGQLVGGMTSADLTAIGGISSAIKDLLTTDLNYGDLPEEGLIPRLIGSQAAVAQALTDLRTTGTVGEGVFARLHELLGDDADAVIGLIGHYGDLAREQTRIDDLNTRVKDLNRTWDDARLPLERAARDASRLADIEIHGIDRTIAGLERKLHAQEALNREALRGIDSEIAPLQLSADQERLGEAERAHQTRAAQAQRELDSANRRLRDARERLSDEQSRPLKPGETRDPRRMRDLQEGVSDAQLAVQQAQERLNREGQQTDADRLAIAQARRQVLEDQTAIDTAGTRAEIESAKDERDRLQREKDEALDPIKAKLDDINDAHDYALQDLQDQLTAATNQRDIFGELVETETGRLRFAREVSDEYRQQLDLVNRLAAEGAGGGAGGGGRGGAGIGGIGGGGGPLRLNLPPVNLPKPPAGGRLPGQPEVGPTDPDEAANAAQGTIDRLGSQLVDKLRHAVTEGFTQGFGDWSKQDTVFAAAGAVIGYKMGGPLGAAMGASAGIAFGKEFEKNPVGAGAMATAGGVLGALLGGPMGAVAGATFMGSIAGKLMEQGERFRDWGKEQGDSIIRGMKSAWENPGDFAGFFLGKLGEGLLAGLAGITWASDFTVRLIGRITEGLAEESEHIGGMLIEGIRTGIGDAWEAFSNWVGEKWDSAISTAKKIFGISSPSTVFAEIGRDIIAGLLAGLGEKWEEARQWFADLPGNAVTAVGDVTETLKGKGKDLLTGGWNGIKGVWTDTIEPWFGTWDADLVTGALGDLTTVLKQKGSDLLNGLWDGAKSKWDEAGAWFGKTGDRAATAMGDVSRALYNKGVDLIGGLIRGITDKARDIPNPLNLIPGGNPFDRKTVGPGDQSAGPTPEETLAAALSDPDMLARYLNRRGILTPAQQDLVNSATSTRWFDQFLPRMNNTPTTPFGVPQTPAGEHDDALDRNTAALERATVTYQETAGLSTSDAGGDGSNIRLQQRINAGGIGGLTATDIHLREGADVTTFGVSAALRRISSAFDRLTSSMPGTSLAASFGFSSEAAFAQWTAAINRLVQDDEQRRNPVNDAVREAMGLTTSAAEALQTAATRVETAAGSLQTAAANVETAFGVGLGVSDEAEERRKEKEREKARQEGRPIPAFALGLTMGPVQQDGPIYAHRGERVLTEDQFQNHIGPRALAAIAEQMVNLAQAKQEPVPNIFVMDGEVVARLVSRRQGDDFELRSGGTLLRGGRA